MMSHGSRSNPCMFGETSSGDGKAKRGGGRDLGSACACWSVKAWALNVFVRGTGRRDFFLIETVALWPFY
jgi:hypothetical protein